MKAPGSQFLHERQPDFHASEEVGHVVNYLRAGGDSIPNEPADKITAYLGFLAGSDYVNDGILTGDQGSIDRQIEAHVIKAEEVPEGYFNLQRRIAREQGFGDIEITREMRSLMTEALQADQRASLGKWVEYLGGEDGGYPDWFKTYVFSSVVKLGNYDKDKGEFLKRSRGTTAAYPDLNREALAYVFDKVNKACVDGTTKERAEKLAAEDEVLQKLLTSANFGKLYTHAVLEVTPSSPELLHEIEGSWTKFSQTNDPRTARRLSGSLQGHGTGWCTAGESTAATQLSHGDFYVYYTRDEDGKDTVPRVAIRMQDGVVAEVRGINPSQELELVMAEITARQLQGLPGGEAYIKKAEDMKRLTYIDNMISANAEADLTADDLRFLYELDHQIEGFGYEADPRIREIRAKRGERDKTELAAILPEAIRGQLETSFTGYSMVANQLGGKRRGLFASPEAGASQSEFERIFAQKDKEWRENGTYDEIVERLVKDGIRFNLLATPEIDASEEQIVALAENFGKDQPYSTYVWDDMYRKKRYSDRLWSGFTGRAEVKFSLIEANLDPRLANKTADVQRRILAGIQAAQPAINARVPSLLDAVTNWYTLRARGDKLSDSTAFDKTFVRHFDLKDQRLGGWPQVPCSYVNVDGRPDLYGSYADFEDVGRLAVG